MARILRGTLQQQARHLDDKEVERTCPGSFSEANEVSHDLVGPLSTAKLLDF